MPRISREQAFMETAHVWAKRSTCARLNVGCVVVYNNRIVSCGYNGHAPGAPHCGLNHCSGMVPGQCGTTHAEVNALREIENRNYNALLQVYITDSPCAGCVEYMLQTTKVRRVIFDRAYRDTTPLDRLLSCGISVYQLSPAGYMMNWQTREIINAV